MKKDVKVGFDFDGTLTRVDVQRYARLLVKYGIDVHIVTARHKQFDLYSGEHEDLIRVAAKLGVPDENIHFLNTSDKSKFYRKESDFLFHLDDNWFVVDDINEHSDVYGICVLDDNWTMKCDELLKDDPIGNISDDIVRKQIKELVKSRIEKNPIEFLNKVKDDISKLIEKENERI